MARKPSPTRRQALQGLGAAAAIAACGKPEPDALPDDRTLDDLLREKIDTIVIVMLENRSFDHYMGALSLEEGHPDVDGLTPEMSNPHPDGHDVFPFRTEVTCLDDPPHSWSACHDQFNEGANDGFVSRYNPWNNGRDEVMGYWGRDMLSTFYTFADHYTLCDRWFCSLLTSTWPNRFYSHAATSDGMTGNSLPTAYFPSIYDRLEEAGLDWSSFYANLPFLALLPQLPSGGLASIEEFFDRAAAGTLPNVCVVEPMYGWNDDHPPNHPKAAQVFVSSVYEALAQSPQWERCALLITYDEHGGFFDHVPPPTVPDRRRSDGFGQLGFRVPSFVVGPWAKAAHVSHEVYEHTSMLALIERIFDLEPLTKRDRNASPLLDCFDEEAMRSDTPHAAVALPTIVADEAELFSEECVNDPVFATNPEQAAARRSTGQPELEAHLAGTALDRRAESLAIYEGLLAQAVALGVLKRLTP